jgi:hypothetical protein
MGRAKRCNKAKLTTINEQQRDKREENGPYPVRPEKLQRSRQGFHAELTESAGKEITGPKKEDQSCKRVSEKVPRSWATEEARQETYACIADHKRIIRKNILMTTSRKPWISRSLGAHL